MRFRASPLLLALLTLASTAQATDTVSVGHRVIPDQGAPAALPMAWRYDMLSKARQLVDERAPQQAPGATLSFVLPKVAPADGDNRVELVQGGKTTVLPMTSPTAFTFGAETDIAADAQVVANRRFAPGEVNHPNVRVRSPGLPDGVQRLGDLRLACAAQMAMAKTEGLKLRALLGVASLLGHEVCEKLEIAQFDPPAGKYDTVTITDGDRRLVRKVRESKPPQLGDLAWSNEARISYSLDGEPAP